MSRGLHSRMALRYGVPIAGDACNPLNPDPQSRGRIISLTTPYRI